MSFRKSNPGQQSKNAIRWGMRSDDVILVLGAFKRSGTNHLRDLLCLHPDCAFSKIPEDFIIAESEKLLAFCHDTTIRWGVGMKAQMPKMLQTINASFLQLLSGTEDVERLVCKTPSSEGIENVDLIFPRAKVVFIVRDGRDTVESGRRSFEWGIKEKAGEWACGVGRILAFEERFPGRSIRIHYEDLVRDVKGTFWPILEHCNLSIGDYPWVHADRAPVRGSSDLRHKFGQSMDWSPRARWEDFSPIGRWQTGNWSPKDMADFETEAGEVNRLLGYD